MGCLVHYFSGEGSKGRGGDVEWKYAAFEWQSEFCQQVATLPRRGDDIVSLLDKTLVYSTLHHRAWWASTPSGWLFWILATMKKEMSDTTMG